jgi:hypothetical protein
VNAEIARFVNSTLGLNGGLRPSSVRSREKVTTSTTGLNTKALLVLIILAACSAPPSYMKVLVDEIAPWRSSPGVCLSERW